MNKINKVVKNLQNNMKQKLNIIKIMTKNKLIDH